MTLTQDVATAFRQQYPMHHLTAALQTIKVASET
jgi:hypothetical protein